MIRRETCILISGIFFIGSVTISGSGDFTRVKDGVVVKLSYGSILPMGRNLLYVDEKPADPIELRVYDGADGRFTLYEDDGRSYNYEKGEYATIPIEWTDRTHTLTIGERKGKFPGMFKNRSFRIVWVNQDHGIGLESEFQPDNIVSYNGRKILIQKNKLKYYRFLTLQVHIGV